MVESSFPDSKLPPIPSAESDRDKEDKFAKQMALAKNVREEQKSAVEMQDEQVNKKIDNFREQEVREYRESIIGVQGDAESERLPLVERKPPTPD